MALWNLGIMTNKVKTALTYPVSLLVISFIVVWFMLLILPKFSAIDSTGRITSFYSGFNKC